MRCMKASPLSQSVLKCFFFVVLSCISAYHRSHNQNTLRLTATGERKQLSENVSVQAGQRKGKPDRT